MAYDAEFIDGFDKYGPVGGVYATFDGYANLLSMLLAGEWTSFLAFGDTPSLNISIVPALSGPSGGTALSLNNQSGGFGGEMYLSKTLAASYARMIAGAKVQFPAAGAGFCLAHNGTVQVSIYATSSGQVAVNRGPVSGGTQIAITSQSRPLGTIFELEWDITIAPSTGGIVKLWFDGAATSVAATGLNTSSDGASAFNQAGPGATTHGWVIIDHLYEHLFLAGGSGDTPLLTSPIVETSFATGDASVQFASQQSIVGVPYVLSGNTSGTPHDTPGANTIFLRQFTPPVQMSLAEVGCVPATTSATANFRPVLYADSGGSSGSLIQSGPQVTGCNNETPLLCALTTPEVLTGGTPYWIGFITDSNIPLYLNTDAITISAGKAANTYSGGPPGTAPTLTFNQLDWAIWGVCNSAVANWPNVGINPPPATQQLGITGGPGQAFNQSATIGQKDYFTFPALVGTPTYIYTSAVKVLASVPGGGSRDINCLMKSSGTEGTGSASAFPLSATFLWQASYFDDDPNTSAPWGSNISALNAADAGYSIEN